MTKKHKRAKAQERARGAGGRPGSGSGVGRREEARGSGAYAASAGNAPEDAVMRTPAAWGQGERGAAGYEDSSRSELSYTLEEEYQRRATEQAAATGEPEGLVEPERPQE